MTALLYRLQPVGRGRGAGNVSSVATEPAVLSPPVQTEQRGRGRGRGRGVADQL
jgi:hypothetical protein